jgi:hypothetical protein
MIKQIGLIHILSAMNLDPYLTYFLRFFLDLIGSDKKLTHQVIHVLKKITDFFSIFNHLKR